MGAGEHTLKRAVSALYDAAVDPSGWAPALELVVRYTGAMGSQFLAWDQAQNVQVFSQLSSGLDPRGDILYAKHYGMIDPHRDLVGSTAPGEPWSSNDHLGEEFVRKSEFYNDFLLPLGGWYVAGARLVETSGYQAFIGLHRGPSAPLFDNNDKENLSALIPHLQWAAQINHRLAPVLRLGSFAVQGLEGLADPVAIVAAGGKLLLANRAFAGLLDEADGFRLVHGRLRASNAEAFDAALSAVWQSTARRGVTGAQALQVSRRLGRRALAVVCLPLMGSAGSGARPAALVMVTDPEAVPRSSHNILSGALGLSRAQAELAMMLLQGHTLSEIAAARGVALSTVKTQLLQLFAQTGANRQSDLISLLTRLAASGTRSPRST
jgi:DNA-binding CsgD family transcriptional regulator